MDSMFDPNNLTSPCNDPDALMDVLLEHVISRNKYLDSVRRYFNNQLPDPVSFTFEELGVDQETPCESRCVTLEYGDKPDNSDLLVEVVPLSNRDRYSIRLMQAFRKLFLADTVCFTKGKNEDGEQEVYISAKRNGTTIVWANFMHKYP